MNIRHLVAFIAVVDAGSFTRAAEALGCTQPTVTTRVKSLEQDLGSALLERLPTEVKLTQAGTALLPYARDIITLADEAQAAVSSGTEVAGRLDICAVESVTTYRLLPLVEYMSRRYPTLRIAMRGSACDEVISSVRQGKFDCAFFVDVPGERDGLAVRVLCPEPLALVGGPQHLLAGRRHVRDEDVRSAALVRGESGAKYHDQFEFFLGLNRGESRPRVLEFDSLDATKHSVAAGLGIALIPEIAVLDELASGKLCRIAWTPPFEVFTQVAWRSATQSRSALAALLAAAEQVVREQVDA
jgi:DNA-binding transcriptional LysR family regulator